MPWAKLEGSIYDNPKVERAGLIPRALYLCSIAYCAKALTDGFVPDDMVPRLASKADVPSDKITFAVQKLLSLELWHRDDPEGGYQVHDYLEYNPTRAYYEALVATKQANGKKGGRPRKDREQNLDQNLVGIQGAKLTETYTESRTPYPVPRDPVARDPRPPLTPPAHLTVVAPTGERPRMHTESAPAHDERWQALGRALAQGTDTRPQTASERKQHAAYVDQLWQLDPPVQDDLVLTVCARYRGEWPDVTCSGKAILNHWGRFAREDYRPPKKRKGPEAEGGEEARAYLLMRARHGQGEEPPATYEAQYTVRGD